MGACDCGAKMSGYSVNDAYEKLVKECQEEHGNNPYSGDFNTCDLVRLHRVASTYTKANEDKAFKMLYELLENGTINKWTAHGADLGVDHYEVIKPKFVKTAGNYKLMYRVSDGIHGKNFANLNDAKEYAMKKAVEKDGRWGVHKMYVSDDGKDYMGYAEVEVKTYKAKPKSVPKGAVLKEVHQYAFVGLAGC